MYQTARIFDALDFLDFSFAISGNQTSTAFFLLLYSLGGWFILEEACLGMPCLAGEVSFLQRRIRDNDFSGSKNRVKITDQSRSENFQEPRF